MAIVGQSHFCGIILSSFLTEAIYPTIGSKNEIRWSYKNNLQKNFVLHIVPPCGVPIRLVFLRTKSGQSLATGTRDLMGAWFVCMLNRLRREEKTQRYKTLVAPQTDFNSYFSIKTYCDLWFHNVIRSHRSFLFWGYSGRKVACYLLLQLPRGSYLNYFVFEKMKKPPFLTIFSCGTRWGLHPRLHPIDVILSLLDHPYSCIISYQRIKSKGNHFGISMQRKVPKVLLDIFGRNFETLFFFCQTLSVPLNCPVGRFDPASCTLVHFFFFRRS